MKKTILICTLGIFSFLGTTAQAEEPQEITLAHTSNIQAVDVITSEWLCPSTVDVAIHIDSISGENNFRSIDSGACVYAAKVVIKTLITTFDTISREGYKVKNVVGYKKVQILDSYLNPRPELLEREWYVPIYTWLAPVQNPTPVEITKGPIKNPQGQITVTIKGLIYIA